MAFTLHASALPKWVTCERSAIWRVMHPDSGERKAEHVAGWIGSAVHALAAGMEPDPAPQQMTYDRITQNLDQAKSQVTRMGHKLEQYVHEQGWRIQEVEANYEEDHFESSWSLKLSGTMDLVVEADHSNNWILDHKTSANPTGVWLQLGAYHKVYPKRDQVDLVGVVHFPRVKLQQEMPEPKLELRDANRAADDAEIVIRRVGQLIESPELALPSPGYHCALCSNHQCASRAYAEE